MCVCVCVSVCLCVCLCVCVCVSVLHFGVVWGICLLLGFCFVFSLKARKTAVEELTKIVSHNEDDVRRFAVSTPTHHQQNEETQEIPYRLPTRLHRHHVSLFPHISSLIIHSNTLDSVADSVLHQCIIDYTIAVKFVLVHGCVVCT